MKITLRLPNSLYEQTAGAEDGRIEFALEEAIGRALYQLGIEADNAEIVFEWVSG